MGIRSQIYFYFLVFIFSNLISLSVFAEFKRTDGLTAEGKSVRVLSWESKTDVTSNELLEAAEHALWDAVFVGVDVLVFEFSDDVKPDSFEETLASHQRIYPLLRVVQVAKSRPALCELRAEVKTKTAQAPSTKKSVLELVAI